MVMEPEEGGRPWRRSGGGAPAAAPKEEGVGGGGSALCGSLGDLIHTAAYAALRQPRPGPRTPFFSFSCRGLPQRLLSQPRIGRRRLHPEP